MPRPTTSCVRSSSTSPGCCPSPRTPPAEPVHGPVRMCTGPDPTAAPDRLHGSCPHRRVHAEPARSRASPHRAHLNSPYDPFPSQGTPIVKLSTSSQELLAQLQTVARVASTRSAVQALSGVQIVAGGDG